MNPAALTDFSSHYLFFNLITDDTNGFFGRGAVAIVTECKRAMLTSYGTWPFKVFILLYTWPAITRTCGLHDVICQCLGDMMSLVSDSRKSEFDLIELLLEGQMPCLFYSDV